MFEKFSFPLYLLYKQKNLLLHKTYDRAYIYSQDTVQLSCQHILNLTFKKVRRVDVKDYMLISILVVKWNSVGDYLQGVQVQGKFGSVSDACTVGFCADFNRESGDFNRSGDVVVNRKLEKEVQREGVTVIKSKE